MQKNSKAASNPKKKRKGEKEKKRRDKNFDETVQSILMIVRAGMD